MPSANLSVLPPGMRIAAARAKACEKMPYFRAGVRSMPVRSAPGLGTLGVTRQSVLMVDSEALGKWTASEAGAVILHEYLHIYFQHNDRFEALCTKGVAAKTDAGVWNVAADCEINDNLVEARLDLPDDPCLPTKYGLEAHRTAEEYFVALKQQRDDVGNDPSTNTPGWGLCGSGAGNPLPGEPKDDPMGRTPIEQHIQRKQDSAQIASRAQGTVPGGIAREAVANLEPPQISWQQKLGNKLGNAVTRKAGAVDYTYEHRSRMQGALEFSFGEDAPVLPGTDAPTVNVALIIDSSGSMSDAQIDKIISEAQGIIRAQGGAKLSLIVCDAAVHVSTTVKRASQIGRHIVGRGGTDFRPAFTELERLKPKPDIVVFGTDGWGAYPDAPPRATDVIWLNLDGQIGVDWGEVIDLNTHDLENAA